MTMWKDILDLTKYDLAEMKRMNVSIGTFSNWLKLLKKYDIQTDIDINLYAIEFASRSAGRYGTRKLPKIPGNPISECRYYMLEVFKPNNNGITYDHIKEMLKLIVKRTKRETLLKWLLQGECYENN